jgi:hypothetical protein
MATYSSAPEVSYVTFSGIKSGNAGAHQINDTLVSSVADNTVYELVEWYGATDSGGIALTLIANYDVLGDTSPSVFSRIMPLVHDGMAAFTLTNPDSPVGGAAGSAATAYSHAILGTDNKVNNSTDEINEYGILTEAEAYERRIFAGYSIDLNFATYEINDGDAKWWLRFKKTVFPS